MSISRVVNLNSDRFYIFLKFNSSWMSPLGHKNEPFIFSRSRQSNDFSFSLWVPYKPHRDFCSVCLKKGTVFICWNTVLSPTQETICAMQLDNTEADYLTCYHHMHFDSKQLHFFSWSVQVT
jgi:hypothetical protein